MAYRSVNPYTGQILAQYPHLSPGELADLLNRSAEAQRAWRRIPVAERCAALGQLAAALEHHRDTLARLITAEMGKPLAESLAELDKCAWVCRYYAERTAAWLEPERVATEARDSYVRLDPMGLVFGIMPWNFPFWQVFRYAVPNLALGNGVLLRHASGVGGCALAIEDLMHRAGITQAVFSNLFISHDQVEAVIAQPAVCGVTLTGSERAGSAVATLAGRYLKKSVMELGGSNAMVVLADADLEQAVQAAVSGRFINAGQSCIAAKRIIVEEPVYEAFAEAFTAAVSALPFGDPMDPQTRIGPLAREELARELMQMQEEALQKGARLRCGGKRQGALYEPTVLDGVKPGMAVLEQETFGPLAPLIRARDAEHALELAAQSPYGLGTSLMTADTRRAEELAARLADGAVFINGPVVSDPRLPFGGTGLSGYGRELARDGLTEFANRKTVVVR